MKTILISLVLLSLLTVLIKIFFIQIYSVETESMFKTVTIKNKVLVSKITRFKKGDIILYKDRFNEELNLCRLIAEYNDNVTLTGQDVFVNDKEVIYKDQTKSYCFRFISQIEADTLKMKYSLAKLNNSGFFQAELTQNEYDEIMKDSVSDLNLKIFPVEKCSQGIFSSEPIINEIFVKQDSVFVLNDNRSDLNDSRTIGLINRKSIVGKVVYIF